MSLVYVVAVMQDTDFELQVGRLLEATKSINHSEFARAMGISQQAVKNASDKKSIPPKWFIEVSSRYGVSIDWLYYGEIFTGGKLKIESKGVRHVSLNVVSNKLNPEGQMIKEKYARLAFGQDYLETLGDPDSMALLQVAGIDMSPQIWPNDFVLFDQSQVEPFEAKPFVVALDGELIVRTLLRRGNIIVLWAANTPKDDRTVLPDDPSRAWIVGRARWLCRALW